MPPKTDAPSDVDPRKKRLTKDLTIFAVLFAISVITALYPLPYKLLGGVFALAAVVWGVRYLAGCISAKAPPMWTISAVVGILASAYGVFGALSSAVIYPVQKEYQDCLSTAITQQALTSCQTTYKEDLGNLYTNLTGQPLPY